MAKKLFSTYNNVSLLYPQGFGFGNGSINVKQQLGIGALTYGALIVGAEVIENDSRVFKKVDAEATDDGCGDGREAKVIYKLQNGEKVTLKRSLLRAKIFGGGLVVFTSMLRSGLWGENIGDSTILSDRRRGAALLQKLRISHGGHTDNHASGHNCGCGAIDKYPEITANAVTFRADIEQVITAMLGKDAVAYQQAIDSVFGVYEAEVKHATYFTDASGIQTRQLLEQAGAVIKELADDHLEDFVVINDVEGETFHQRQFDMILKERGVVGTAQVFVVDAWRGRMYAKAVASLAAKQGQHKDQVFKRAFVDFLVRTLATAATLTSGDQPVFHRASRRSVRRVLAMRSLRLPTYSR